MSGGLNYQKPLIAGTAGYTGPFSGKQLSSIQAPNATTIVFHLDQPYGDWPWVVSATSLAPVPAGREPAATFGQHPITSGPYAVRSYTPGVSAVLVRNKYWTAAGDQNRAAGPGKIVIELNQDPTVEAQTLIANGPSAQDALGAGFVPPAQLAQVGNDPSAKSRLVTSPASPLEYLAVNVQSPKLKNLKVREALEYAVNREAVIIASGGTVAAEPATTLITPGIAGRMACDLYPAGLTGDPAKAKSLPARAGVQGLTLTLATGSDPISTAIAQAVQEACKTAGINVVIKSLSRSACTPLVTGNSAGGCDLAVSSRQPDFPSAMDNIEPLFSSAMIGNGNYDISRLADPTVDALITKAEGTIDATAAGAIWAQADKAILALVGEPGSGKSVTALPLLGLLPATARVSGSAVLAGGTELVGAPPGTLRSVRGRRIGAIFQDPFTAFNPIGREDVGEEERVKMPAFQQPCDVRPVVDAVALQFACCPGQAHMPWSWCEAVNTLNALKTIRGRCGTVMRPALRR